MKELILILVAVVLVLFCIMISGAAWILPFGGTRGADDYSMVELRTIENRAEYFTELAIEIKANWNNQTGE